MHTAAAAAEVVISPYLFVPFENESPDKFAFAALLLHDHKLKVKESLAAILGVHISEKWPFFFSS